MATKLQTKLSHKRLTTITVNGRAYPIDADCCVVVDNDADVKKLLSLGDEWTDKIGVVERLKVSRTPMPGQSMRGAAEFVDLMANDTEVAAKVSAFHSFRALASFAEGLGFRFNETEFDKAGREYASAQQRAVDVQKINDEKLAKSSTSTKADKKAEKASKGKEKPKDYKLAETPEELPENLPENESGEWPEPSESMGSAYLRAMAEAYEVQYDAGITKAALVKAIHTAMFSE